MKSFTDLAQHLSAQGPRSAERVSTPENNPTSTRDLPSRGVASMAAQLSLDEPVIRRGVVEHVHKGGSAFAVLGSGEGVFVTRSITKRLELSAGDVLEMTIVGNYKNSATEAVPYRALFAVRSKEPLQSEEPAPAPEPEPVHTKPMTFKDVMGPKMLDVMKPGFLYRAADFAFLADSEKSKALTNVLESLLAEGRVQRIAVHSSPDKRAGRLYWCLPGQASVILNGLCSGNEKA